MTNYINKDELLEKFNNTCSICGKMEENCGAMCRACYFDDAKDIVDDMPAEDVKHIVIEELEKIKAEIDVMYDSNQYSDEFEHGIMSVREIINKHISELRKESEAKK